MDNAKIGGRPFVMQGKLALPKHDIPVVNLLLIDDNRCRQIFIMFLLYIRQQ